MAKLSRLKTSIALALVALGLAAAFYAVPDCSADNAPACDAALAAASKASPGGLPAMFYGDASRGGPPFAKDPSVIEFQDRYLLYYSMKGTETQGWGIGIAASKDLIHWKKIGEFLPPAADASGQAGLEAKGICAPGARVLNGKIHLFYQTYGNGIHDSICHAWSDDGIHFTRDPSNPIFHPMGAWSCGRAIDAGTFVFKGRLFLFYATRDPNFKIQMIGVASADLSSDFSRSAWTDLCPDGPVLKPELPWEKTCLEAPTVCPHDGKVYLFYAGAYDNSPQQIGCAVSDDAVHFKRLSNEPLVPNGAPGAWNHSESGHPGVFTTAAGQSWLFYQGNDDDGKSWHLSVVKINWNKKGPVVAGVPDVP